ncbi:MAG: carotenoid 1,2-hydratase [Pseudomonadales bacterium]
MPEHAMPRHSHWCAMFCLACCVLLAACEQPDQSADVPLVGLRVTDVLGADERGDFARAQQVIDFEFPRDHGPHPAFRSEWWYLTAALEDESGKRYGVQFTLFRQALTAQPVGESAWQSGQAYLAHLALTDVSAQQHYADQRFARKGSRVTPALAGCCLAKR